MNGKISLLIGITFGLALLFGLQTASAEKIHPALIGPRADLASGDSVDVWVFFTDRGFTSNAQREAALREAEAKLTPAARARRMNVKQGRLVDEYDLPVNAGYVQVVLNKGARFRTVSRYVNALSARLPQGILPEVAGLPFVKEIRPVAKGWRSLPQPEWLQVEPPVPPVEDDIDLDYGPSYEQLEQINVIAVHDSGFSGNGVLVCLLDTGFFTDHEALVNQPVVAEWDFINNDPETQNEPGDDPDQHNHGTYTFSALGGAHEGDLYGPAYGASFILGKTESIEFEQPIEEDWYVAGLEWADSLGAQVVSTSLGYLDWYDFSDLDGNTTVTAIGVDIAVANGIVCVTAAGNERETSWAHIITPADADSVIAVGAVNSSGEIASFSSPGPTYDGRIKPEVCARGVGTWCATPWSGTSGYAGIGGTSLATPLVAGSVALILEAHPDWPPMMVREALMATADNAATPNNDYGWGIIDVYAAINFNFPPKILSKDPFADTVFVFPDSAQDFPVTATDYEEDPLLYHWRVDEEEIYSGPDSAFEYAWSEEGEYFVDVIVEDSHSGTDTASWLVEVNVLDVPAPTEGDGLPQKFALYPPYPNPFNPETVIRFDLPKTSFVTAVLYNLNGRRVKALLEGEISAGSHELLINAADLPSGMYFLNLQSDDLRACEKLVLLK
jgi:subtilisin family serine protease